MRYLSHSYTIFTEEAEVPAGYQGAPERQPPTSFTPSVSFTPLSDWV